MKHKNTKIHAQGTHVREIDYLRGFAILAVILIHTSANFTKITPLNNLVLLNILIDIFTHFAVPLFIFISGFVLAINNYNSFSVKSFYIKRFRSILPQYLIFSILYITVFAFTYESPSPLMIIFKIISAGGSYHLWFFAILIEFYIFYPIIIQTYHHFEEESNINDFLILSWLIQMVWVVLTLVLKTIVDDSLLAYVLQRIFISYLFYFSLGIYASKNFDALNDSLKSIKSHQFILGLITILLTILISLFWVKGLIDYDYFYNISPLYFIIPGILETVYYPTIFILLFGASKYLSERKNKIASTIYLVGKHSFGIYLIHVFFMIFTIKQLDNLGTDYDDLIFYPLLFIISTSLSLFSVHLISYFPHSELLIGINSKKK